MATLSGKRSSREQRPRALGARALRFQRGLLRWYGRHQRPLPWRRTRDPYRILVSEVMLQQTQVVRVEEYYRRFLGRYPTIRALAAARPAEVRDAWAGLGYYARARNLHAAARCVARTMDGRLPADPTELERLPGVGRYTAAAVASIAFGRDVGTVDTNIARVLSRAFRLAGRAGTSTRANAIWRAVNRMVPPGRASEWNQALMDLGATICVARAPRCERCPVRRGCLTGRRRSPA